MREAAGAAAPAPGLGPRRQRRRVRADRRRDGRLRRGDGRRPPDRRAALPHAARRAGAPHRPAARHGRLRPVAGARLARARAALADGARPAASSCSAWRSCTTSRSRATSRSTELVDWLAGLGGELVVEFPTREDPMVQRLLAAKREDAHEDYELERFERLLAQGVRRSPERAVALRHPGALRGVPPRCMSAAAARSTASPCSSWPVAALHLAALWSFAFVQPLFDLLSHNADFFVARGNTAGDILRFAFVLVLVPPAILVAAEALAGLVSQRARRTLHLAFVALLAGAFVLELLKRALPGRAPCCWPRPHSPASRSRCLRARAGRALVRDRARAGAADLPGAVPGRLAGADAAAARAHGPGGDRAARPDAGRAGGLRRAAGHLAHGAGRRGRRRALPRIRPAGARGDVVPQRHDRLRQHDARRARDPHRPAARRGRRLATSRTYPRSVFTLLGDRWDQHVLEPVTDICPPAICAHATRAAPRPHALARVGPQHRLGPSAAARRPRDSLPPIDRGWADFGGIERGLAASSATSGPVSAAGGLVGPARGRGRARHRRRPPAGRRPPLHVIHVVAPHVPWRYLPAGVRYLEPGPRHARPRHRRAGAPTTTSSARPQRHLLQVGFTDRLLARLIGNLKRAGLWDRALVVVVADHGASFRPRGPPPGDRGQLRRHRRRPAVRQAPGPAAGRVDDRLARTIDMLPTIAETVGRGRGWRFDGAPLGPAHRRRPCG